MSAVKPVLCTMEDGVATVQLNRPTVLNAVNEEMLAALCELLRSLHTEPAVRAVLLTGSGRGFCSGAELRNLEALVNVRDIGETLRTLFHPVIREMRTLPKPIVVAVNGVAAGSGMSIALAGDIILGSEAASFCAAYSKIGLIPDAGCTFFLPRIVGENRAKAMAMLAEPVDAQEAFRIGLLHKLLPCEHLISEARAMARQLARMPTTAFALIKRALDSNAGRALEDQLELEATLQSIAVQTDDFREGIAAFLNKRVPVFGGA